MHHVPDPCASVRDLPHRAAEAYSAVRMKPHEVALSLLAVHMLYSVYPLMSRREASAFQSMLPIPST